MVAQQVDIYQDFADFTTRWLDHPLNLAVGAEKIIAAVRGSEKIAVEMKSFLNDSFIYDLHEALGQYLVYQPFLKRKEAERLLFLAVPGPIYEAYFSDEDIVFLCEQYQLRLLVFDLQTETLVLWKKYNSTSN